jgi:hypothetical protein
MNVKERSTNPFRVGPAVGGEITSEELCDVCEARPAMGVAGLCSWCRQEVAAAVGEMQA